MKKLKGGWLRWRRRWGKTVSQKGCLLFKVVQPIGSCNTLAVTHMSVTHTFPTLSLYPWRNIWHCFKKMLLCFSSISVDCFSYFSMCFDRSGPCRPPKRSSQALCFLKKNKKKHTHSQTHWQCGETWAHWCWFSSSKFLIKQLLDGLAQAGVKQTM